MTEPEHVHDVALVVRRDTSGARFYESDGPCQTCGQAVETLPRTAVGDRSSVRWFEVDGLTVTTYARGAIPPEGD